MTAAAPASMYICFMAWLNLQKKKSKKKTKKKKTGKIKILSTRENLIKFLETLFTFYAFV